MVDEATARRGVESVMSTYPKPTKPDMEFVVWKVEEHSRAWILHFATRLRIVLVRGGFIVLLAATTLVAASCSAPAPPISSNGPGRYDALCGQALNPGPKGIKYIGTNSHITELRVRTLAGGDVWLQVGTCDKGVAVNVSPPEEITLEDTVKARDGGVAYIQLIARTPKSRGEVTITTPDQVQYKVALVP